MPTRKRPPQTATATLRQAILDHVEANCSYAALKRETGVLRQAPLKFAHGETGLLLDAADKLVRFFELILAFRLARRTLFR